MMRNPIDFACWPLLWRWPRRLRCHGDIKPCQYVDHPMCNLPRRSLARRRRR